jgi:hypothetical protein
MNVSKTIERGNGFSNSIQKPKSKSRHLYAGRHLASRRVSSGRVLRTNSHQC